MPSHTTCIVIYGVGWSLYKTSYQTVWSGLEITFMIEILQEVKSLDLLNFYWGGYSSLEILECMLPLSKV